MTRDKVQNGNWTRININTCTLLFPTIMKDDVMKQLERSGIDKKVLLQLKNQ